MGTVNVRYYAVDRKHRKKNNKKPKPKPAGPDNTIHYRPGDIPHPKASFRDGAGTRLDLPFAPTGGDIGGFARRWAEVERPSRANILVDTGPGHRIASYTLTVAHTDGSDITGELFTLAVLAARSSESDAAIVVLGLSGMEGGPWRITDLTVKIQRRQHGTNNPTQAEVEITFGEVSAMNTAIARSSKQKNKKK